MKIKRSERSVNSNFGKTLRYWRDNKGLSLKELGLLAEVSPSYLNRLENGDRKAPSMPIAIKISKILQIPLSKMINISDSENDVDDLDTITELLLYNDFMIDGKVVSQELKQVLVEIIKFILESAWDGDSKFKDIVVLSELIDDFKEELKAC